MHCQSCGKPYAPTANFCSNCGAAVVPQPIYFNSRPIIRPRANRVVAGVLAGFARHFGWDLMWLRVIFSLLTFFTGGTGFLVYIACWVILPEEQYALPMPMTPYSNTNQPTA
jgi:phage shock protein C